jgi:Spy/CpxP family protein refolding chaperone
MKARHLLLRLCAATFLTAFSTSALAAHGGGHGGRDRDPAAHIEKRVEHLTKNAELSPQQAEKVRQILRESAAKMQALHKNRELSPQARHEQHRALRQSTHQAIKAVLSTAQVEKLKSARQAHRKEKIEKRAQHLQESLGLSDATTAKITAILSDAANKRQALHEADRDRTTPPTPQERQARHDELRALRDATHQAIVALLTPEQREKFQSLRGDHPHKGDGARHGRGGHGGRHGGRGRHGDEVDDIADND